MFLPAQFSHSIKSLQNTYENRFTKIYLFLKKLPKVVSFIPKASKCMLVLKVRDSDKMQKPKLHNIWKVRPKRGTGMSCVALFFPANVFSCLGILLTMSQRMSQIHVDSAHTGVLRTNSVLKSLGLYFTYKPILNVKSEWLKMERQFFL